MDTYQIAISEGDGVGKELITEAKKLLTALAEKWAVHFELHEILSCTPALEQYGVAIRDEDLADVLNCAGFLFGNISGEEGTVYALKATRQAFRVCTNIRPAWLDSAFAKLSPLKQEITDQGMDILMVRDLMGGMINGERMHREGVEGREASDLEYYNETMIEHSAHFAFQSAKKRSRKVTSIDKASVLASSNLWRSKVCEVGNEYPGVALSHDYVDHAAMELLSAPGQYDVILTSNVFGDILADEIAQISGAPWLFGSAELASDRRGIYTPNQLHHPFSREFTGRGIVNPSCIFSATAMLLRYSCGRDDIAKSVEAAVNAVAKDRLFTQESVPSGGTALSTAELGSEIISRLV